MILQIIPVYGDVRVRTNQGYEQVVRAWALVEEDGDRVVRPLCNDRKSAALGVFNQDDVYLGYADYSD